MLKGSTQKIYMIDKHSFLPLGTASKFPALSIKLLATILFKEYPITSFHSVGLGQWAHSNSSCLLYILLFASISLLAGLHFPDGSKTSIIISPRRKLNRPFLVGLIAICPSYVARLDNAAMIGR